MLLSLTGASGSGKSTILPVLVETLAVDAVACVEFDSVGVPSDADTGWRQGVTEHWVQRAVAQQRQGCHLLLCGQVPVGELLAAPSASRLSGIAACLLHCSPEVRRQRLVGRGMRPDGLHDHLAFGEWFIRHMTDPTYAPEVIRVPDVPLMRWDRWADWQRGDPRWSFEIVETDALTPEDVANRVVVWVRETLRGVRPVTRVTDEGL